MPHKKPPAIIQKIRDRRISKSQIDELSKLFFPDRSLLDGEKHPRPRGAAGKTGTEMAHC